MVTRSEFVTKHPELEENMHAYNQDGDRLGRVVDLREDSLTIQKGLFFPKDFTVRYDDIADISNGAIIINQRRTELEPWRDVDYRGWTEYEKANEVSIPVREEKLEAQKVSRQTGEVRVRKVVHTEMKHITVPVQKEEVVIERQPVSEERAAEQGEHAFEETTTTIPVMEEEVEVTKHPVTREEVKVHKEKHTEEAEVSEEVRKEEVKVEKEREKEKSRHR